MTTLAKENGSVARAVIVTRAEREIWRRVALGEKREFIAGQLGKSVKTVDGQLTTLRQKLNARCIADLVRAAVRYGVITVEVVK